MVWNILFIAIQNKKSPGVIHGVSFFLLFLMIGTGRACKNKTDEAQPRPNSDQSPRESCLNLKQLFLSVYNRRELFTE
jgi:hypothetical protein